MSDRTKAELRNELAVAKRRLRALRRENLGLRIADNMNRGLCKWYEQRANRVESQLSFIETAISQIVGVNSVLLEPKLLNLEPSSLPPRMISREKITLEPEFGGAEVLAPPVFNTGALILTIERHRPVLATAMHAEFYRMHGNSVVRGYCLTDAALKAPMYPAQLEKIVREAVTTILDVVHKDAASKAIV